MASGGSNPFKLPVRAPHPAKVAQPRPALGGPAARPPHPAIVAQPAGTRPHPARVAQRSALSDGEKASTSSDSKGERLAKAMEALKRLPRMKWEGSVVREFEDWVNRKGNAKSPTAANCWNAVLLAAYNAGLADKDYIKRANVGARADEGLAFARPIVIDGRDKILKKELGKQLGKQLGSEELEREFFNRVQDAAPRIPRGDVIVLHSKAYHVCLSIGNGMVLELDKQTKTEVKNPKYNENYERENKEYSEAIKTARRALSSAPGAAKREKRKKLDELVAEHNEWKKRSSPDRFIRIWNDNDIREVALKDLDYVQPMHWRDLDGIYWGPLPAPSELP